MESIRLLVVALAMIESGKMVFDGVKPLTEGAFSTEEKGPYKGKLGSWAIFIFQIGLDPHSLNMKIFFLVFGSIWFITTFLFLFAGGWFTLVMLGFASLTLWYASMGTVLSLIQIGLLVTLIF